jgi:hypothetical protein
MRFYPHFILVMGRSPGFAYTARYSSALFRLAFATATSLERLNLASYE